MKKLTIILFALLLLGGCSGASYKTVSADKAKDMIENHKLEIIDVRTAEEFAEGHIPNATLIPLDELEQNESKLDKNKTYLMVCRSGNRSGQASDILVKKGYKNIYNLSGGMNEWTGEVTK
jgi:rhodanese-related sulfurtransferase